MSIICRAGQIVLYGLDALARAVVADQRVKLSMQAQPVDQAVAAQLGAKIHHELVFANSPSDFQ